MENDNNTTLPCIVVDNNKTELICIVSRQDCVGFGRNFFLRERNLGQIIFLIYFIMVNNMCVVS